MVIKLKIIYLIDGTCVICASQSRSLWQIYSKSYEEYSEVNNLDRQTNKWMERGFHTFSLFHAVYSSQSRCNLKLFPKYNCFFKTKKPGWTIFLDTLRYSKLRIIIRCFLWAPVTLHCGGPTHYSIIQGQPINYSSISSTHLQNSTLIPPPFPCARCGVLFHFILIFLRKETLSQQESVSLPNYVYLS
jgi:hypothetical protein